MIPQWLHLMSVLSLIVAAGSAVIIIASEWRSPQHMWIMNLVWPLAALFGSVAVLWMYFAYGKRDMHGHGAHHAMKPGAAMTHEASTPFPVIVAKGSLHCGSGCTLGDIIAEWLAYLVPGVAVLFGWQSLFADKMFAVWALDFVFAFTFGVFFQYFTIKPMRDLTVWQGLVQAIKADALSLTAWQVGMYGFMAFASFYLFGQVFGTALDVPMAEFWFMMQIAMIFGFMTSYPVNWWLIRTGVKEEM